jgi:hypothetical protein
MPTKLLIVNVLLMALAGGSAVVIARQIMAPMPMPAATPRPSAQTPPSAEAPASSTGADAYAAVAARNLFSPTRTDTPAVATTAATSPTVKPNLFGVVLRDAEPIAYLEDPSTKRVAGYRVGDSVAGGTVQTIAADNVVIERPDGKLDVRLRDPSRPRPAPLPAAAVAPGAPGAPGAAPGAPAAALPGVIPPAPAAGVAAAPVVPPTQPGIGVPPGQVAPTTPTVTPRRPLPPNLLRRLPQGAPPDAPQQ